MASRGNLHAAHFCYLVAEAEWGLFSNKNAKIVLIGSSHHQNFQAFATNEAIQCTEIYEYAHSLDSASPVMEAFQSYKLIYALRLAELGFPADALRYCEVISETVLSTPSAYKIEFLMQLHDLASRLKYHDVHYQMCSGEEPEMPDPQWLLNLTVLIETLQYSHSAADVVHEYPEDMKDLHIYSARKPYVEETCGTPAPQVSSFASDHHNTNFSDSEALPGDQSMKSSQLQSKAVSVVNAEVSGCGEETVADGVDHQLPSVSSVSVHGHDQDQPVWTVDSSHGQYLYTDNDSAPNNLISSCDIGSQDLVQDSSLSISSNMPHQTFSQLQQQYPQWHQPQSPDTNNDVSPLPEVNHDNLHTEAPPVQSNDVEVNEYWEMMTGTVGSVEKTAADPQSSPPSTEKHQVNQQNLSKTEENKSSSGFLSMLFGWKKSHQVKLPDDKNPSIVWDEEKKKWIDKDGHETDTATLPPPPKIPTNNPPANLSLRSGPKSTKSRYVNPVGEKGRVLSPPTALLPTVPPGMGLAPDSCPPSFLVPGPSLSKMDQTLPDVQQHETTQPPDSLQMRSRYISESSSIDLEDDSSLLMYKGNDTRASEREDGVPMLPTAPPVGQPMFINPTQFRPPAPSATTAQSRRLGPTRRAFNPIQH